MTENYNNLLYNVLHATFKSQKEFFRNLKQSNKKLLILVCIKFILEKPCLYNYLRANLLQITDSTLIFLLLKKRACSFIIS